MITYRGIILAKNSEAYELHEKKDFAKLDKLLKEVDQKSKELIQRYESRTK